MARTRLALPSLYTPYKGGGELDGWREGNCKTVISPGDEGVPHLLGDVPTGVENRQDVDPWREPKDSIGALN